jgi:NitT/TauT family transport system ATP-binding protein
MTASPGRIAGIYDVSLPRPRDLLEVRFDAGFQRLYATIWDQLRDEVVRAYASETLGVTVPDLQPTGRERAGI